TSSAAAVSTAGSASPGSTPGPSAAGTASPAESAAARDAASPAGGAGAQSAVSDAASGAGALLGTSADASDSGPHTYAATPPAGEGLSAEHTPASTRTIIAVTACPTGIAHTYMAADALVAAGERAGVRVQVETQGSSGTTPLSAATIAAADAVILATDVGVKDR